MAKQLISSGSAWEGKIGYSRAVRIGNLVHVSGTTATNEKGDVVGIGEPAEQAEYILQKIEAALKDAGASMNDVVRTRMYVTRIDDWESIALAHGKYFGEIRPATTIVEVSRLINANHLVEIEAEAIVEG
ncbi:RidA family protein [Rubinisphaera margarita]|uniref:RidA family protein n=1 Tax=Rubinisphaera margarita TaxID=2909586 RepID=UPI001EE8459D|nr:RidA family protein [Rubinisphaera margarita]MCG6155474.1 RidA family protein [Rubinisphaera margarita]